MRVLGPRLTYITYLDVWDAIPNQKVGAVRTESWAVPAVMRKWVLLRAQSKIPRVQPKIPHVQPKIPCVQPKIPYVQPKIPYVQPDMAISHIC